MCGQDLTVYCTTVKKLPTELHVLTHMSRPLMSDDPVLETKTIIPPQLIFKQHNKSSSTMVEIILRGKYIKNKILLLHCADFLPFFFVSFISSFICSFVFFIPPLFVHYFLTPFFLPFFLLWFLCFLLLPSFLCFSSLPPSFLPLFFLSFFLYSLHPYILSFFLSYTGTKQINFVT